MFGDVTAPIGDGHKAILIVRVPFVILQRSNIIVSLIAMFRSDWRFERRVGHAWSVSSNPMTKRGVKNEELFHTSSFAQFEQRQSIDDTHNRDSTTRRFVKPRTTKHHCLVMLKRKEGKPMPGDCQFVKVDDNLHVATIIAQVVPCL